MVVSIVVRAIQFILFGSVQHHTDNIFPSQLLADLLSHFYWRRPSADDQQYTVAEIGQPSGICDRKTRRGIEYDPVKNWSEAIEQHLRRLQAWLWLLSQ